MSTMTVHKNTDTQLLTTDRKKLNLFALWRIILLVYTLLLCAVGYIAFWPQAFNKPENTTGIYLDILNTYQQQHTQEKGTSGNEINLLIKEMIKSDADKSGDIQELASQSFHLLIGALLAFLSSSATLCFQQKSP